MKSWISIPDHSDFPLENIPFGIGQPKGESPRALSIIGDTVIDLAALTRLGYLSTLGMQPGYFEQPTLNAFIGLGKETTSAVRKRIMELFTEGNEDLSSNEAHCIEVLYSKDEVEMLLPLKVENYTDFYSSKEHATNVGTMFRDPANALLPNWKHIPIGYHGRASSIVITGTPLHRPLGQTKAPDAELPSFGPTKQLDFELEVAFVVGKETALGDRVPVDKAEEYIFGLLLFNDWSARDIQSWEYVPLGPFLAKNFGSTVSPWIVTLEALEPFRVQGPEQDPKPLPYLSFTGKRNFDLTLDVFIKPEGGKENKVCHSNFKYMYWNMSQQLAHHTVNGCNIKVGDLYASGTISGPEKGSFGSMLELTWRGTQPIELNDGTTRKFIEDNDTVIVRGYAMKDGLRIGFGEATGKILPAKN